MKHINLKEIAWLFVILIVFGGAIALFTRSSFAEVQIVNTYQAPPKVSVQDIVYRVAHEEGIDWLVAVRVIDCESRWDKYHKEKMTNGSYDRGLYSFNSKAYAWVSDDQAFDPEQATRIFAKEVKAGNLHNWLCAVNLGLVK